MLVLIAVIIILIRLQVSTNERVAVNEESIRLLLSEKFKTGEITLKMNGKQVTLDADWTEVPSSTFQLNKRI